jgi:hypothetical protein
MVNIRDNLTITYQTDGPLTFEPFSDSNLTIKSVVNLSSSINGWPLENSFFYKGFIYYLNSNTKEAKLVNTLSGDVLW